MKGKYIYTILLMSILFGYPRLTHAQFKYPNMEYFFENSDDGVFIRYPTASISKEAMLYHLQHQLNFPDSLKNQLISFYGAYRFYFDQSKVLDQVYYVGEESVKRSLYFQTLDSVFTDLFMSTAENWRVIGKKNRMATLPFQYHYIYHPEKKRVLSGLMLFHDQQWITQDTLQTFPAFIQDDHSWSPVTGCRKMNRGEWTLIHPNLTGKVGIQVRVESNGSVTYSAITKSGGKRLDTMAMELVRMYQFNWIPAHRNGIPVASEVEVEVDIRNYGEKVYPLFDLTPVTNSFRYIRHLQSRVSPYPTFIHAMSSFNKEDWESTLMGLDSVYEYYYDEPEYLLLRARTLARLQDWKGCAELMDRISGRSLESRPRVYCSQFMLRRLDYHAARLKLSYAKYCIQLNQWEWAWYYLQKAYPYFSSDIEWQENLDWVVNALGWNKASQIPTEETEGSSE